MYKFPKISHDNVLILEQLNDIVSTSEIIFFELRILELF
jgi:hypothetical protein